MDLYWVGDLHSRRLLQANCTWLYRVAGTKVLASGLA